MFQQLLHVHFIPAEVFVILIPRYTYYDHGIIFNSKQIINKIKTKFVVLYVRKVLTSRIFFKLFTENFRILKNQFFILNNIKNILRLAKWIHSTTDYGSDFADKYLNQCNRIK